MRVALALTYCPAVACWKVGRKNRYTATRDRWANDTYFFGTSSLIQSFQSTMPLLEIACFNTQSARIAQDAGADRIELCDGIADGGTTPQLSSLQELKEKGKAALTIPVFVMIRPRGGDFTYTAEDFSQMKMDIVCFKPLADGFVFGILEAGDKVDVAKNSELVALADPLPCTFHRAFDSVGHPCEALEVVIECGFKAILTSGGALNASAGAELLRKLVERAQDRIQIMPGGGVRSSNICQLSAAVKAPCYHSSAIIGSGELADAGEVTRLKKFIEDAGEAQ